MAWNEPGNNGDKNPWGNSGKQDGPPDLEEVVRKMQERFGSLFGGSGGSGGDGGGSANISGPFIAILLIALAIYLLVDMAYIIQPAERGVVMRFGSHVATLESGMSFRLPRPIEYVEKVDIDKIRTVTHKASMLTQDENIVDIEMAVQYKIKEVDNYLFEVVGPDATLHQATESAVREVIGKSKMDFVLTGGRAEIAASIKVKIQENLNDYNAGLFISSVNMQPAKPPEPVKSAFDDAIKAREDEQRKINEAQAYRNEVLPTARGEAARMEADSSAYKARAIAKADGESSRFKQLLTEYEKAPEVTRERLYLETVESVLANTSKVMMDNKNSNALMYLPLDKMINQSGSVNLPSVNMPGNISGSSQTTMPSSGRELIDQARSRLREIR